MIKNKPVSELRQDPITEKWVVIASGRAKRPTDFKKNKKPKAKPPKYVDDCPFCNLKKFPQSPDTLILPDKKNWRVRAFQNKFPAFSQEGDINDRKVGLYRVMDGVGFHEVVIPKEHDDYFSILEKEYAALYVKALVERYKALAQIKTVNYIQIIQNHGREAGGSVEHPHSQIFAIPILPTDEVLDLFMGAEKYYKKHGRCAHCDIIEYERKQEIRVVYENKKFIVICPFTPRSPYEQWVLPKEHSEGFEKLTDEDIPLFVDAAQVALKALRESFDDPPYNIYFYSPPCDDMGSVYPKDQFSHFHWHAQILPRLNTWGGFEMATGVEITVAVPEEAAAYLRSKI